MKSNSGQTVVGLLIRLLADQSELWPGSKPGGTKPKRQRGNSFPRWRFGLVSAGLEPGPSLALRACVTRPAFLRFDQLNLVKPGTGMS